MSKGLRVTLLTIGGIVAVAVLLLVGMNIGRAITFSSNAWTNGFSLLRSDLDHPYRGSMIDSPALEFHYGNSMLGVGMMGTGMMGHAQAGLPYEIGMMGQFGGQTLLGVEPMETGEARAAVQSFLEELDVEDLEIGEVMVFDNHAYVQVIEQSSGIGALELLVDPVALAAYPEHGPATMWNLKYGLMSGLGGFGMMGGNNFGFEQSMRELMREPADAVDFGEPPVGPQEAVELAQRYLDVYLPGAQADETPDPFYEYYTLHIEREGKVVGMLSVNGATGQVWLHTWHGELLEMSDHE